MSTEIQDFDLECQGAYHIAEKWPASPALQAVWAIEDVVALFNKFLPSVLAAYEQHCKTGELPENLRLITILDHLREFGRHGRSLVQMARKVPSVRQFEVSRVAELEAFVSKAEAYINDADEWAELENAGPSNEALLKFAAENRAPQAWYDESIERL